MDSPVLTQASVCCLLVLAPRETTSWEKQPHDPTSNWKQCLLLALGNPDQQNVTLYETAHNLLFFTKKHSSLVWKIVKQRQAKTARALRRSLITTSLRGTGTRNFDLCLHNEPVCLPTQWNMHLYVCANTELITSDRNLLACPCERGCDQSSPLCVHFTLTGAFPEPLPWTLPWTLRLTNQLCPRRFVPLKQRSQP